MISLPLADYVVIVIYLIAVLVAGAWFARLTKTGHDFFVGGNQIPWWVAGISLYMTTFSAWMFTGAASFVYNTGWFGFLYMAGKPIGFLIGFKLSAVRWRRSRISSPVEYVEERYNHVTRIVISIVLVISMMYWPGHHLAAVAKISAPALFPNVSWAIDGLILFFGIFVLIYTVAGGLWAVSVTDVIQFLVLFAVCVVLVPVVLFAGDHGSSMDLLRKLPAISFQHEVRAGTVYTQWYLIGFVVAGIFGNVVGDKAQRFFSVRDERAANRVGWLAFALFCTSPLLFGIPPLVGKVLWPEVSQLPFYELATKPDENVFIAVVMHYMPAGVVGLFLAAMIAASMSALDSVWNAVASIVSIDLYKGHFRPAATERELLIVGRLVVVGLTAVAVVTALFIVHSTLGIFTISNIVLGLFTIPVTIPLLVGILTKWPSTWSAIPAIAGGSIVSAYTRFALNWTLGSQYIAVIIVCTAIIFTSRWIGRLYDRRKEWGIVAGVAVSAAFWVGFSVVEAPTMVFGQSASGGGNPWTFLVCACIGLMNAGFAPLYARDETSDQGVVDRLFERLERPIDPGAEVGVVRGRSETLGVIGWSAVALGALPALIGVVQGSAGNWPIYLALSIVLAGSGVVFLVLRRLS